MKKLALAELKTISGGCVVTRGCGDDRGGRGGRGDDCGDRGRKDDGCGSSRNSHCS